PLGSGGKRVWITASPYFLLLRSAIIASRMKLEGRGSAGGLGATSLDEVDLVVLILLLFYMSHGAVRTMRAAASAFHLQEDLPVVCAASRRATGRRFRLSAGRRAPWLRQQSTSMVVTQVIF